MREKLTMWCVALFLTLSSVSSVRRVDSINELKKIHFGLSVPRRSLILLHWFANTVYVDDNDNIWLNFDPDEDYGSHHYGNYQHMLDPLPQGHRYYTVGSLYQERSQEFPSYVINPRVVKSDIGRNMARIIFRVTEQNDAGQTIDQVYITQHNGSTNYDAEHTYQVTTSLLRDIQEFSLEENQGNSLPQLRDIFGSNASDLQLQHIRNTWGNDLAPLGLMLFIVIQEKYIRVFERSEREKRRTMTNNIVVNASEHMKTCRVTQQKYNNTPEKSACPQRRNMTNNIVVNASEHMKTCRVTQQKYNNTPEKSACPQRRNMTNNSVVKAPEHMTTYRVTQQKYNNTSKRPACAQRRNTTNISVVNVPTRMETYRNTQASENCLYVICFIIIFGVILLFYFN